MYTDNFKDVRDVFRVLVAIRRNSLSGGNLRYKTDEPKSQGLSTADQATKKKHPIDRFSMYSSNSPRETDEDCVQLFFNKPNKKKELVVEMRKNVGGEDLKPVFYCSPHAAAASGYVDGPRVEMSPKNETCYFQRITHI